MKANADTQAPVDRLVFLELLDMHFVATENGTYGRIHGVWLAVGDAA